MAARRKRGTVARRSPLVVRIVGMRCPLLAQSGHAHGAEQWLLSVAKRTEPKRDAMSAVDSKRTLAGQICCAAQTQFSLSDVVGCRPRQGTTHEAARIHHAARRRGGTAARGVRADPAQRRKK